MPAALLFDLDETLVAQNEAFRLAWAEAARVVCEAAAGDKVDVAATLPAIAAEVFGRTRMAESVRRCGFGGRDILWGDPSGDSPTLVAIASEAASYRRAVWAAVLERQGIHDDGLAEGLDGAFRQVMHDRVSALPNAQETLASLSGRYKIAVVTNGMPASQRRKLRHAGLEPYCGVVVVSSELGIGKPAAEPFLRALEALECSPQDAVMIGDNLEVDVRGAQKAGIRAIWVRSHAGHSELTGVDVPGIEDLGGLSDALDQLRRAPLA